MDDLEITLSEMNWPQKDKNNILPTWNINNNQIYKMKTVKYRSPEAQERKVCSIIS